MLIEAQTHESACSVEELLLIWCGQSSGSQSGVILGPQEYLKMAGHFWLLQGEGCYRIQWGEASNTTKHPTLQTGHPPQQHNHLIPNVNNAKLEEALVKSMKSEVVKQGERKYNKAESIYFGAGERGGFKYQPQE